MDPTQQMNEILNDSSKYGYESHAISSLSEENDCGDHTFQDCRVHSPGLDATDVSYSPSHSKPIDYEIENSDNECLLPPDRMARKQRSFHRRGGESHGNLLKAAVLASMEDFESSSDEGDDGGAFFRRANHQRCTSNLSLQSLQEALEKEGISPRKRARRHRSDENDSTNMSSPESLPDVPAKTVPVRPEPPVRRVSRRTSYDSRCSAGADSESSLEE